MPTAPSPENIAAVEQTLAQARRRLAAQARINWACRYALCGLAALIVFGLWQTFVQGRPFVPALAWEAPLFIVLGAVAGALYFRPAGLRQTAAWIDARAGTRDRFQTALAFSAQPSRSPLEDLALNECVRFANDFPVEKWTPIRWPRDARWLPVAALALAALGWYSVAFPPKPRLPTAMDAAVAQKAAELQKIAAALRQSDPQNRSPELACVAEAMEKSAQRLKAESAAADEAKLKAALREMSSLEAMLNAMRAAKDQPVSPAELSALAAALAANESTRAAAEAMRSGQLEAAASQLEKALEALKERGDPEGAMQQLARSLQEQAEKLTDAQKNEIARQMQAAGKGAQAGQPSLSQEALSKLAQAMRQAGQNGAGKSSTAQNGAAGRPMTERELQSLLDALANMKDGMRPGDGQGGGKPGDGKTDGPGSLALVEAFGKKPGESAGEIPSGKPGSEHDTGHSENIFGPAPESAVKPEGPATRLTGEQGDGESLQQFIGAASDNSRATRAYRENYDRLVPSAQNAVEQENIPLGSRRFVRRYFENIRPTE